MKRTYGLIAPLLMVAVMHLTGCERKERIYELIAPADVRDIDGQYVKEVELLSDKALERIGLQLTDVSKQQGPRNESPQLAIPYSALLYDPDGKEWVYTNPKERVYVRAKVNVDYIEKVETPDGRMLVAFLKEGPEIGTKVVCVGAEELLGTEKKIGHIDAYIRQVQEHK